MRQLLTLEEFKNVLVTLSPGSKNMNTEYLYDIYSDVYQGLEEISSSKQVGYSFDVNSQEIIFYLLGEYVYSTNGLNEQQIELFNKNDSIKESMTNVIADKIISLGVYHHDERKLTNKYLPPISSMELYVNLMLNVVNNYPLKDRTNAILVDLLNKTLSIARCILNLLCEGYETEAFAMWRTLHECECVLILLDKYKEVVIPTYIKHMQYGLVFKSGESEDENHQKIFAELKNEMKAIDLKSKDMKKFIEYGWLLAIPEHKDLENFKLNFRDGVESLAGLHQYSQIYMTSSEILHGTPLLIYSNKTYFHLLTIVNLYESFFRIEKVFQSLFFANISDEAKDRYLQMKKLYYSQLISIHQREIGRMQNLNKKSK